MIQALIRVFQTGGLELTAEEIADTLWLAAYIDPSESTQLDNMADVHHRPSHLHDLPSISPLVDVGETTNTKPFAHKDDAVSTPAQTEVHLPPVGSDKGNEVAGIRALSFRSPAATALPGKLALARSLRPLLRRIPSRTRMVLDETATAQRIAEVRNSTPILQPGQERWLDLSIVVDEWQTMVIWRETVNEFIELLQQIGAFRTVQTYWMVTEIAPNTEDIKTEQVKLYATQDIRGRGGRVCNERELIDQGGRRLIFVLSDCTAPVWYNGAAGRLLAQWGKSNMVALVQMLPTALWDSSMLAHAFQVYVSTLAPGLSNAELSIELPWYWMHQGKPAGCPVPVVTLEPEALVVWSKLLTCKGNTSVPAFYLPLEPVTTGDQEQEVAPTAMTPEERWQHFRATASPLARELAGYLSAAPLSLPVMRLVQQVMLPQSRQVHLAEVFRSGLIQRVTPYEVMVNSNEIRYEFIDGVRKLLLTTVLISVTKLVLEKVSEYISNHNSQLRNFHALILDPSTQGEFEIDESSLPLATVASTILQRLGGQYAKLAERLDILVHVTSSDINEVPTVTSSVVSTEQSSARNKIQKNYALLIGVNDYIDSSYSRLSTTIQDVTALEKILTAAGYVVHSLHNQQTDPQFQPTRSNIWAEIENVIEVAEVDDLIFIYFGGHSALHNNKAYLVTQDARKSYLQHTAIDLNELTARVNESQSKTRVLVLDTQLSRRNSEFERQVKQESTGLAMLLSCRQNEILYEYNGSGHSVFVHFILEALQGKSITEEQSFVTLRNLFDYVTDHGKQWAAQHGLQQWPIAYIELVENPTLVNLDNTRILDILASSNDSQKNPTPFVNTSIAKTSIPEDLNQNKKFYELGYLDFELQISNSNDSDYSVSARSPAGEAHATWRLPWSKSELENRLKDLEIALLRSGRPHRMVLAPEEQAVQRFGSELFDAVITGEVRNRYDISQEEARRQDKGLRLKLGIEPPALAALPWEFLYDSRSAEYVCLSRTRPLVRYLALPRSIHQLSVVPPLRILGMIASPSDLPALNIIAEKQRLEDALKPLVSTGLIELTWLDGQTWRDLQRTLRSNSWHIFHFIGHGGFDGIRDEGTVALVDTNGRSRLLSATELGRLLADHVSLRLVYLNACEGARSSTRDIFSSIASILVRRGIPAVVAMQYEITDVAAIEFAQTFYESLAERFPVDVAVAEARIALHLSLNHSVEWGVPVLYMRTHDGHLFDITNQSRSPQQIFRSDIRQDTTTGDDINESGYFKRYLDFDLSIELVDITQRHYRTRVLSPVGEVENKFTLPFSDLELEHVLLRIGNPPHIVRAIDSRELATIKEFGGKLYQAIFHDQVLNCLLGSLSLARQQGYNLRIRLRLSNTSALTDLPWEYLYDPINNRFFAQSNQTPLLRYLALPQPESTLQMQPPLKVLVMISNPKDSSQFDVEAEWRNIQRALNDLEKRELVQVARLEQGTIGALQRQLRRDQYHIFHFIGHGSFDRRTQEGALILEDNNGLSRLVTGNYLGIMLRDHPSLRLAMLDASEGARTAQNNPFAGIAQTLLQQGIPAIIAMQFEITEQASRTLTHSFYTALADGYPVEAALTEARKAIYADGNDIEWGTPALYMRVSDGQLFDISSRDNNTKRRITATDPAQQPKQA